VRLEINLADTMSVKMIHKMQILKSTQENFGELVAKLIADKIANTLNVKENFVLALPGGNSIKPILKELIKEQIEWKKVHIFLTDEREVDPSSDQSNFNNIKENLISHIDIPEQNVHHYDPAIGIENYQSEFGNFNTIGLAILGVGEDGHVASLFPNHPSIESVGSGYIKVTNSPKPPSERISLSLETLQNSDNLILLFIGENKEDAFDNFQNPEITASDCPAKFFQDNDGFCVVV
jgi:6-phosphogluconolactonase